jgi:Amidohydrolase family
MLQSPVQAKWTCRLSACLALALAIPELAFGQGAVAYRGVAIETAGKAGRLENATLVLRDGKIEAVGVDIKPPEDAQIIDGHGKTIMPGIIDPHKEIVIAGGAPVDAPAPPVRGGGGRRGGFAPRGGGGGGAFTRVADNLYPYDPSYRVMLRSGLTDLNLVTANYGQSAVIRLAPSNPESMLLGGDGFLFTAVTNDSASLDVVRTGLETAERAKRGETITASAPPAQAPQGAPARGGAGRRGGGGRRGPGAGPGFGAGGGGFNIESLKAWQAVYEGKAPLFVNAASAAAITHLLKAIEPYKDVKVALAAPGGALYETIEQLKGKPVKVIIRPNFSFVPNTRYRMDISKLLHEAGIEFAFTQPANQSDLVASQDVPLFSVATLVKSGLPRKIAMEALTARPAALIGLEKTHGTIEPGKTADLLIFTGDPLDPGSQLSQVLIEGRTVYEN